MNIVWVNENITQQKTKEEEMNNSMHSNNCYKDTEVKKDLRSKYKIKNGFKCIIRLYISSGKI